MAQAIERNSVVASSVALALSLATIFLRTPEMAAWLECEEEGFDRGNQCYADSGGVTCAQCLGGYCGVFAQGDGAC